MESLTYLTLNLVFSAFVVALLARPLRRAFTSPSHLLLPLVGLLFLTLVFDSLIISLDIVRYTPEHILGLYAWRAPVEDFFYTIIALLLAGGLWHTFTSKPTKENHEINHST
ncbi:lycopene cyclase domain-containing protein [Candidatus Saccharibacteria bacterium]|nr:lycopene cyclase domain-containing protein [Candidatus Saccharibacteria bacterium]